MPSHLQKQLESLTGSQQTSLLCSIGRGIEKKVCASPPMVLWHKRPTLAPLAQHSLTVQLPPIIPRHCWSSSLRWTLALIAA